MGRRERYGEGGGNIGAFGAGMGGKKLTAKAQRRWLQSLCFLRKSSAFFAVNN